MNSKLQVAVGVAAAMIGGYVLGKNSNNKEVEKEVMGKCPHLQALSKASKQTPVPAEGDLLEYSVVYTDRAVNLMSSKFGRAMRQISTELRGVYNADALALVPGSGSYGMEAAARQFGNGKKCLVIRNGYFSYRWSDIFHQCDLPSEEIVIKARAVSGLEGPTPQFAPVPIDEVVASILEEQPAVVFAPHVETSTGIILPDEYLMAVAEAVHQVGGVFVLDCIASGTIWVDMKKVGVDVIISAPQKGWSGPACVGIVLMNNKAKAIAQNAELQASGSMACNLKKWIEVMDKYDSGAFMYYTTLPTDALMAFRDAIMETKAHGYEKACTDLWELGRQTRAVLEKNGYPSVSAEGFQSPGVVVSYAPDTQMVGKFKTQGLQIAGGVPFKIDEPEGLMTFRLGLFGLDKIGDIKRTVSIFEKALVTLSKL